MSDMQVGRAKMHRGGTASATSVASPSMSRIYNRGESG